jgi:hypothetical protein
MPENSGAAVQTAQEEATTLTPSEQAFLQAFAQEVMPFDFVEAVLYKKEYGQLYVRTVMSVFELEALRSVVRAWGNAIRSHNDMVRLPFPEHRTTHPPSDVQDLLARGFHILAQE